MRSVIVSGRRFDKIVLGYIIRKEIFLKNNMTRDVNFSR